MHVQSAVCSDERVLIVIQIHDVKGKHWKINLPTRIGKLKKKKKGIKNTYIHTYICLYIYVCIMYSLHTERY